MMSSDEEPAALVRDPNKDGDFTLVGQSAWITAGEISVHIRRDEQGVSVSLYPAGSEDQDELARCHVEFDDA
jgi:hypothetical protein